MNREEEIEEMTAHIQKAFDVINKKFRKAPSAETIASNLYLHRYRREDIVEKEVANEIFEFLCGHGDCSLETLKWFAKNRYGVVIGDVDWDIENDDDGYNG